MFNLFKKSNSGSLKPKTIAPEQLVQDTAYALDTFAATGSDELLDRLGLSREQVYAAVMSDDEVDACREDVVSALIASSWRLYGENTDEIQLNKLYKCVRRHLPAIAEQVVIAKMCGFSVARLTFEQDADGFVALKQVISRHDELSSYTPKFSQLIYNGKNGEEVIDTDYTHLFLTNKATSKNPAGEMSVVRIYPAVMLRKEGWRFAYQFSQRYAQPYIVVKTDGDRAEAVRGAVSFRNGGVSGVGTGEDVVLLQNSANGEFFRQLEQMANARIQKSILGRVKTSELQTGSRSAQQVEQYTQSDRIDAYLNLLATAVQKIVDSLLALNAQFGTEIRQDGGLWFEFVDEIKVDIDRAERDAKYLAVGAVAFTEDYFVEQLGIDKRYLQFGQLNNQVNAKADASLSLKLADDFRQPESQLKADQQILQPKIHAILSAAASVDSYDEFNKLLNDLDLSDGDQLLIDKLVWQNSQAWADGADSLKGRNDD